MSGDVLISKGSAGLGGQRSAFDRLVGALQEKHGWNRERATKELRRKIAKRVYN